jgi:hypothetical protein
MQQTDPETPELDDKEAPKKKKTSFRLSLLSLLSAKGPRAWLWVTVAVLIFANLIFLFLSDTEPSPPIDTGQQLDQDADNFERLSFWQRLWNDKDQEPVQRRSVFDGLAIDPDTKERAISLMIDNHSLARDGHEGMRSASVVYEALVEGGITRIMLVFPYQELDRVGPVRSARDYFVDFSEEYGGIYVHAGGSPTALDQLWASDRVYSIEEDIAEAGETYSFRADEYEAPHDLFFDLLLSKEWAEEQNYTLEESLKTWCFIKGQGDKDQGPSDESSKIESVSLIELNFSNDVTSSYYVQFQYDAEDESYRRFYRSESRSPHIDKGDNLQIAPQNLIVQIAPSFLIEGDEKERLEMQHVGSGDGFYYSKGKKQVITWEKNTKDSVTKFFGKNGDELCVHPGQTWVAIVDGASLVIEDGEEFVVSSE